MILWLVATPAAAELRVCADPNNLPFSNQAREGFENRIVEHIAADWGETVHYVWWAQRRGNVRNTLNARLCDVIPGVASTLEMLATTRPYYRTSYMVVTRADRKIEIEGFDDPLLRSLSLGVQMIGDDGANTPPAMALAKRGLTNNVHGYMVYGDYGEAAPQSAIVDAVSRGEVDLAYVWGPVAGYFGARASTALSIRPVTPWLDGPTLPMAFDVSMGVRKDDYALRRRLDNWLTAHQAEITNILTAYGVPLPSP
ncbi:quinoprotein dehydrogenase-associated putative ABC transporter substrate-binding protein [Rhizorhabdus argentea]|uniref:quinoprotein dehydrogenase-associated putative ABC transporter substrate-binding protein n=1 Tax=Rhizorhabdus argentea TaxID=1387174 RepID=UPI0030ED125A